jgi:hypothetical protein
MMTVQRPRRNTLAQAVVDGTDEPELRGADRGAVAHPL